ncbi:MAG: tryptophan 2,3-dioxygenase family protein [Alphaproteobacteria bacterium]|nr:tryptophan 2,3-dioxygenase family protein [Alphaproteobacteria bacterium]
MPSGIRNLVRNDASGSSASSIEQSSRVISIPHCAVPAQRLRWRFRDLTTIDRIISSKLSTGGTSGVDYLTSTLNIRLVPELWAVRTSV